MIKSRLPISKSGQEWLWIFTENELNLGVILHCWWFLRSHIVIWGLKVVRYMKDSANILKSMILADMSGMAGLVHGKEEFGWVWKALYVRLAIALTFFILRRCCFQLYGASCHCSKASPLYLDQDFIN